MLTHVHAPGALRRLLMRSNSLLMRSNSFVPGALFVLLALHGCFGTKPLHEDVREVLERDVSPDGGDAFLTGAWTNAEGERVAVLHAGQIVSLMPVGPLERRRCHFAEGSLEDETLTIVSYRQGRSSDASVGGLDVAGVRRASVRRGEQVVEWADGGTWKRVGGPPGSGSLTGRWSTEGGAITVAHEGEFLTACALDREVRSRWTVVNARVGDNAAKLWSIQVLDGRVTERLLGTASEAGDTITWSNGRVWRLEERVRAAPPAPPRTVAPASGDTVPNTVQGTLTWTFDWTDVPGASAYHLEVVRAGAPRAFLNEEALTASTYTLSRSGGAIPMTEGWSWRVRAKVGGAWTDWSMRALFEVN